MTITIIILLSLLSTFIMFWVIAAIAEQDIIEFFGSKDEDYVIFNLVVGIMITFGFIFIYCTINNTFSHFEY